MQLLPITTLEKLCPRTFKECYLETKTPVILKNYAQHWPAMQKWTYAYLQEVAGAQTVNLHGKWQNNEPTKIEMPTVKEMLLKEYLSLVESNAPSDLRIFLFNLFKYVPHLESDFDYTPITAGYLKDYPYLFFGCAGSDVRLHYDIDLSNVFITQFHGTKRITLFDQQQTKHLYKLPFTTHSAIDMANIDYNKFPDLKKAVGYQCELKHGETLFMPSGIWHYIEYLTGSFSLSLRSLNSSRMGKIKGAYNVFVMRRIDELANKYYKHKWINYKLNKVRHLVQ